MIDVAVVGLGYFSQLHLEAWSSLSEVRLTLGVDPDPERRAWAESTFSVATAADTAEISADVVDIVAPPPAHRALILELAAPGRLLICQKPFATSLGEARGLVDHAEAQGARLIIHENFRFQPWYRQIKAELAAHRLGDLYSARFDLRPGDGRGPEAYLARQPSFQRMERFLIHETGVHFVDLFAWLFGPITSVYAELHQLNPAIAGEDAGHVIFTHKGGMRSHFDGNRLSDHASDNLRRTMGEMRIEGSGGVLSLDGQGVLSLRGFESRTSAPVPIKAPVDDSRFGGGCVEALIAHVVRALRGEGALENDARDYLRTLAVVEAIYDSAATGRRVDVPPDVPDGGEV